MSRLIVLLGLGLVAVQALTGQQGQALLALFGQKNAPAPSGGVLPAPVQQGLPPATPAPTRPGVVGGGGGGQFTP